MLLVCDPRDALGIAWTVREAYRKAVGPVAKKHAKPKDRGHFTISAAVLFAHSKQPAGLLFRDLQRLLKEKAKTEAGRDAVAIRLAKRGGFPVQTAFRWDEPAGPKAWTWVESFDWLVDALALGEVSSRQTFTLRRHEDVLIEVFAEKDWQPWLRDRLSRREPEEAAVKPVEEIAHRLAPFFHHKKMEALRILRFLVHEIWDLEEASS